MVKKEQIILEKIAEKVDKGFRSVDERFKKIDERFDANDKRFDFVDKKLNDQDKRSDNIAKAVLNLLDDTEDIKENMVIRKDLDGINTILDKQTVILKRLDQ